MTSRLIRNSRPLIAALALLAADPALANEPAPAEGDTAVSLKMRGPAPSIEVTINGEGSYRFLINLGASTPRLSAKAIAALGMDDEAAKGKTFEVDSLTIGDETFDDVEFKIWEDEDDAQGSEAAGVLTLAIFADHLVTLDLVHEELRLDRGSLPTADSTNILEYSLKQTSDPNDDDNEAIIIPVEIAGRPMGAVIRSNTRATFHFPSSMSKNLPLKGELNMIGRVVTDDGTAEIHWSTLDGSLKIGASVFEDPTIRFSELFETIGIGVTALSRFEITFDHANRRVRFHEPSNVDSLRYAKAAAVANIIEGEADLKTAFNNDKDKTRFVMILSPT